jgi:hypothetical protein
MDAGSRKQRHHKAEILRQIKRPTAPDAFGHRDKSHVILQGTTLTNKPLLRMARAKHFHYVLDGFYPAELMIFTDLPQQFEYFIAGMDGARRSKKVRELREQLQPTKHSQASKQCDSFSTKCLLVAKSWSSWLSAEAQDPEDPWPLAKDLFDRRVLKPGHAPLDLSRDAYAIPMPLLPILIDLFGHPGPFLEAARIQEPTSSGLRQYLVGNPVTVRLQMMNDDGMEFVELYCDPEWTTGKLCEIIRRRIVSVQGEDVMDNMLIRDAIMKYGRPFVVRQLPTAARRSG